MYAGSLASPETGWAPQRAVHEGWWTVMAPHYGTARLVERLAVGESACRCGTLLARGSRVLEVEGLPPEVRGLLDERTFCSPRCVRAAFLELLNSIDQLETPAAKEVVEDLGVTFAELATALGQALSPPV